MVVDLLVGEEFKSFGELENELYNTVKLILYSYGCMMQARWKRQINAFQKE